ncbi:putative cellulose synthase A catalytic subunit 11 [UDP-forming] [Triticum dicoccoides]|uniref:putative cellulose synthase A catalytic subunit 11 [UDP-forming] n=1 Tax=Triticum dicoccoides TaxID=85692 RepID=UPI001891E4AB|nr:putative cellulose synthase A catalytic subunit 11 [UDP-forming] [Triticum dicoccoides]
MDEWSLHEAPPNTPERGLRASAARGGGDGRPPPEPLSSKAPVPSAQLSLYRAAVALRAALLALFLRYRVTHPVPDAYGLWLTAVACEAWLALSWLAAQLPKLSPATRATHLHRLDKDDCSGGGRRMAGVDVFVSAADASREPPLATANAVLSVLAADYPAGRLACYVSDDGADMLLFEALFETARLARRWVPFCRRHGVEPRAPEPYFARNVDYLRDKVAPSFVKERRAMKREYEEFKVRMNYLAAKTSKVPEEGWLMSDGTPWPGNNSRDHPAMIQVLLGHSADDRDAEGVELPRLFYVSREKKPGFQHHKKAGAMNALLRVSAVLTNGAYVLNLDYDHYVNNSGALREAMCFLMDPEAGNRTCFVQFPLRPAVSAADDEGGRWGSRERDSVFFDVKNRIDMKCLDGIQGPVYVGSGCCFNRKALYGFEPAAAEADDADDLETGRRRWCCFGGSERRKLRLRRNRSVVPLLDSADDDEETVGARRRRLLSYHAALQRHFGHSTLFIASAFKEKGPAAAAMAVAPTPLLKEAIHVVSCAYEERTRWGKEVGWIYGAGAGLATGFRMHARGWASAYCVPARPAFRSYAGASPSDMLAGASRRASAAMGILLSRHCPVWAGGGSMRPLQRLAYVNCVAYPLTSIPLTVYCALSAVCLLTGKFIFPDDVDDYDGFLLVLLLSSVIASVALELKWSGVSLRAWWRAEKLWVVIGTSAGLAAVFQGILRACTGIDVGFSTDTAAAPAVSGQPSEDDDEEEMMPDSMRSVLWTNLLVPPISVLLGNLAGVVVAVSYGMDHGHESWGPLGWKLVFAAWVVAHLQGFLRGLLSRRERAPTIAVLWSVLFVSILSLMWVNTQTYYGPSAPSATHQPIF